jgi:trehalose-phosphatase
LEINLFKDWGKLETVIRNSRRILLFLDYDGTLTPIVSTPEEAKLDVRTRNLLNCLAKKDKIRIGIISGRKLSRIKKVMGLKGIFYCGNHGLEIEGPGIKFIHPAQKKLWPVLKVIKTVLQNQIKKIKGAWVEDKGLGLALHFRLVGDKNIPQIKKIFKRVTLPYVKKKNITLSSGKRVLEVYPFPRWNKGKAVGVIEKFIQKRRGDLTIYIGDDVTDEDAFKVLRGKGLTVYVGESKKSYADYYLKDTAEVVDFLKMLSVKEK